MKRIQIDPITRLEGHGKIDIFLNDDGGVADCFFIVPELHGFETFCVGRPVEEMTRITTRICGVCSEAHHVASAKACDAVYHVDIPSAARKLRELLYSAFFTGDHATHFYILGGPDFVMGPAAPVAERNIIGMIGKLGVEVGKTVIGARAAAHEIVKILGGKTIHMVSSIAGDVTKGLTTVERDRVLVLALAQQEYERFYETLTGDRTGHTPVHQTLATHWARVVELIYAAERTLALAQDDEILSDKIRVIPTAVPDEGVGQVEAPRGTLTHHYFTDERGILQKVNLIVGTTNNHAAISMSIKKATQGLIRKGVEISEGLLNKIEMAFRAYDPCFACATHSLPGHLPMIVRLRAPDGSIIAEKSRERKELETSRWLSRPHVTCSKSFVAKRTASERFRDFENQIHQNSKSRK